jgi:hypothetical protein
MYNSAIYKFSAGSLDGLRVAGDRHQGNLSHQLYRSRGIFVDRNGSLFVCDYGNRRIQKWTKGATEGSTIISAEHNDLNKDFQPRSIFINDFGTVFVYDSGNFYRRRFVLHNGSYKLLGGFSMYPYGLCETKFDVYGNMYLLEGRAYGQVWRNKVAKYTIDNNLCHGLFEITRGLIFLN